MGRQRFVFNLGALATAMMLVIAAIGFGPVAAKWVGFGIGIAGVLMSLLFAWLTLADGLVAATLARSGPIAHELSRERVVHVLEVVERPPSGLGS